MKHKLTYTDNYILVVDNSEIKEGDWMHRNDEQPTFVTPNFWWDFKDKYRKITAHLPLNNSPILKGVPLLPSMKVKDDVEKLANELISSSDNLDVRFVKEVWKTGYNKAKEKYKYTEEDMRKAIDMARDIKDDSAHDVFTAEDVSGCTEVCTYGWRNRYKDDEIIQSLSQPKMPTCFEYIDTITTDEGTYPEWVGNWMYE